MRSTRTRFLITGLSSLIVYVLTLAPTITWRNNGVDSGDLATAVAVGGVPHPPGYPTYLILGEVFKRLPFGDIAYRLNLLSATCMALAIAVTGLIICKTLATAIQAQGPIEAEGRRIRGLIGLGAASASLTLAFSEPIWSQAVITEVYALNLLFAALLLYGALQIQPINRNWLVPVLFGLLGLSLGNHLSIVLLLPWLIWILMASARNPTQEPRWRWRLMVITLLAFCMGLSIYIVIPLRAAALPPVNWGLVTTWQNFLWLVRAEPYRQFLFALPRKFVPARIIIEWRLLAETFLWWGLPVGLVGLRSLIRSNRSLAYGSLTTFLFISIYAIGYNTTDSQVYLLPAWLIFTVWLGWGLYELGNYLGNLAKSKFPGGYLVSLGLVILPSVSLLWNFTGQDLSQDYAAYNFAEKSLQLVAPEAVIVVDNDPQTFALWYGRYGLGLRPDVAVVNANLLSYAWYRQTLHQTHPNLRLADQTSQPLTTLRAFVGPNLSNLPIYLATLEPPTLIGYRLETLEQLTYLAEVTDD